MALTTILTGSPLAVKRHHRGKKKKKKKRGLFSRIKEGQIKLQKDVRKRRIRAGARRGK